MALRRDYIHRMIEQLTQALARILGLRKQGLLDEAARAVADAAGGIAGMDLGMAASVDAATLARHLADPDKMAALARLLLERGEIAAAAGDAAGAATWRGKAVALGREARRAGGTLDEVLAAAVER